MPVPGDPYIKTTYKKDGSVTVEPHGFGGTLCRTATAPYDWRQGGHAATTATAEAGLAPALEAVVEQRKEHA